MTTITTKTFRSGNSEAVRLPKEIAYGREVDLEATRSGDVVILRPKKRRTPAETVAALRAIGFPEHPDFERPPFEAPDRPGL